MASLNSELAYFLCGSVCVSSIFYIFRLHAPHAPKMRLVTVRRSGLFAKTLPIQNLGETEVACKLSAYLDLN